MMTRVKGQLRRRLLYAFASLCMGVTLLIPFTFWVTESILEEPALVDLMGYHLIYLTRSDARSFDVDTARSGVRYRRVPRDQLDRLPGALGTLEPGIYHGVSLNERVHHVQVRDINGERAFLAYDISFVEHLRKRLIVFVTCLTGMAGLAAWVFARRAVDTALSPLNDLLHQIDGLDVEARGQRLRLSSGVRELSTIVDSLNGLMGRLDTLIERERAFAASTGHELRTPLAILHADIEMLEQLGEGPPRLRARLRRAAQDLRFNLDALLALSHVQEPPERKPMVLNDWLRQEADSLLSLSRDPPQINWQTTDTVVVPAAPGAINVVFGNLLRNALRVARRIDIQLTSEMLRIRDDGPGIDPRILPHIFEPGTRGVNGGSGMGLYIAANVARQYGWRLSLCNHPAGGAEAIWTFAATTA